jgi:hypothetical protein
MLDEKMQKEWQELYDKEKLAIQELFKTSGFEVILRFWEREVLNVDIQIDKTDDPDQIYLLTLKKRPMKKFLNWLYNLRDE